MPAPVTDQHDREIESLRAEVREKELLLRQAQERVNDYDRDWLYTTCCNFRGTIARLKELKEKVVLAAKIAAKLLAFVLGIAGAPLQLGLRIVGVGRRPPVETPPELGRLKIGLTEPLPETIVSSKGNSFLIGAWAFHPEHRITHLEVRMMLAWPERKDNPAIQCELESLPLEHSIPEDQQVEFSDRIAPVFIRNIPNRGVLTEHFPECDPRGNSFWSGFYAMVMAPAVTRPSRAQLIVKAHLENGTVESKPLGKLTIQPRMPSAQPLQHLPQGLQPMIAVCMTTYNPPAHLFRQQIDSIRQQTHRRWVCIIRDDGSKPASVQMIRDVIAGDPRFVLRQNEKNLGFYKNFETVLADVPFESDYVALSDQDDRWHPDKLETLLKSFKPGTSLVYSDTNIVDESGRVKATTYWTTRDNNYKHFPTLLLANTITGAASMFRRNLLDYLLPFPEKFGDAYHDHWLACTAMALGELRYVDRPLYDYTQHSGNVVGHVAPKPGSWSGAAFRFFAFFWPPKWSRNVNAFLRHGRGYYFADLVRIQHTARNVLQRCGAEASEDRRNVLQCILTMADCWSGKLWLTLRPFRHRDSWRKTVGVERNLLHAMIWRGHLKLKAWWGTRLTARGILRGVIARQCLNRPRIIENTDSVNAITRIIAPLTVVKSDDSPVRLNVIISIIDFRYVFGGYITVFHLCRKLVNHGFRVRLIVTDECDFRPVTWADNFRNFPGLEDFLDRIELIYAFDRQTVVPVNKDDAFLATSWWTAHIAKQAITAIGKRKFVYLIQEYEPGFYPLSSLSATAAQSYEFPHCALFSTEILQEFFQQNKCGVFAKPNGFELCASFQNAITSVGEVTAEELRIKKTRRLLFYCRPEPHALRNMFDTGLLALREAIKQGAFRGWEFHGIGTVSLSGKIRLIDDVFLTLLPRLDQEEYRKILKEYDVGLALMCSPHPSLVPLEMAKAGMWTVTNGFANKSDTRLKSISSNFLPTAPTVEGVTQGLLKAHTDVRQFDARAAGANVNWATDWDQAFPESLMNRLAEFIHASMMDREQATGPLRRAA